MLYLLRSFGENNLSILKLGFSGNLEKRLGMYFYHNPLYKTLSTREGDEYLESLFHIYLKGLGLQFKFNGKLEEWYVDDPQILEIFKLTQEELERKIWETREGCFEDSNFDLRELDKGYKLFRDLYEKYHDDSFEVEEIKLIGEGKVSKTGAKRIDILFWKIYKKEIFRQEVKINPQGFSEDNMKIAQDFLDNHFYKTGLFHEKLKMYCEFMDTHKGNKEIENIIYFKIRDDRFRKYYNFYGTKGCSARMYRDNRLQEGIYNATKEEELRKAIYNYFKIGQRYTKTAIKEGLWTIYQDLDITSKKPKTSDLGKYFTLIRTRISNKGTGKLDEGYRLESL